MGAQSRCPADRMRTEGYSTLEELQIQYTDDENPMDPLNYVWYQYRWQHIAAKVFEADGEDGLVRFWDCFHATDRLNSGNVTATTLAPLLSAEVSPTLGRAVQRWR